MKKTKRETTKSAAETYAERKREIATLIEAIEFRLQIHEGSFSDRDRRDWGFVGDLGSVAERLREIADFLPGGRR
jgi:hypothetical protein